MMIPVTNGALVEQGLQCSMSFSVVSPLEPTKSAVVAMMLVEKTPE
jgi:hypothetical protein